jgi:hypothetical protein
VTQFDVREKLLSVVLAAAAAALCAAIDFIMNKED